MPVVRFGPLFSRRSSVLGFHFGAGGAFWTPFGGPFWSFILVPVVRFGAPFWCRWSVLGFHFGTWWSVLGLHFGASGSF